MNRENKLAIIIGFSLVLVVAVLISDHFSRARAARVGNDITSGKPADFGAGGGNAALTKPIGPEPVPVSTHPLARTEGAKSPTVIIMHPANSAGPDPDSGYIEPKSVAESNLPVSKGKMKQHEVKDGDSLFQIAKAYYGDGTLYQKLADYNKAKNPNLKVSSLKLGAKLDIPPKDVLLGEAVMPSPAEAGKSPAEKTDKDSKRLNPGDKVTPEKPAPKTTLSDRTIAGAKGDKDAKPPYQSYKIAKGDDLSTIARKLLGSAKRGSEIYELNKDIIADPDTLVANVVIKVPAR